MVGAGGRLLSDKVVVDCEGVTEAKLMVMWISSCVYVTSCSCGRESLPLLVSPGIEVVTQPVFRSSHL